MVMVPSMWPSANGYKLLVVCVAMALVAMETAAHGLRCLFMHIGTVTESISANAYHLILAAEV